MPEQNTRYTPGRLGFSDPKDIDLFVATLEKYERGEITADAWRAFRLLNGVYGQRQEGAQMLRVKIPQGILNASQLETLAQVASEYADGRGHVTTRQNIQFYFIPLARAEEAMRLCDSAGLTTKEACGHSVRNVIANPLAGVDPEEVFDVTPYADALTRHFLRGKLSSTLPRKFKIGFEGAGRDAMRASINDLSFKATKNERGERGFRVLVGGGTSTLPRTGSVLVGFLPAAEIFSITHAVLRVFHREGERADKHKARIKWLIKKIGWEAFYERTLVEWELVKAEGESALPFDPESPPVEPITPKPAEAKVDVSASFEAWSRTNLVAQKQAGLSTAVITLPLGDLTPAQFRGLAQLATRFSDGTVRTTIEQNLVVRHVPNESIYALYNELEKLGLSRPGASTFADVTSCAGAHTCAIAVTASRGMGSRLSEDLRDSDAALGKAPGLEGASIKISGCPNGCGQHHIASISLQGAMRRVGGRPLPLYMISVGGGALKNETGDVIGSRFARLVGKLPAHRVSAAIRRVLALWESERAPQQSLDDFLAVVPVPKVKAAIGQLFDIDEHTATPEDFVDLGQEEPFTVAEGEAECAM